MTFLIEYVFTGIVFAKSCVCVCVCVCFKIKILPCSTYSTFSPNKHTLVHAVVIGTSGEMGFFRVELGKNLLGVEGHISWATPGTFSTRNVPCAKDGSNCGVMENSVADGGVMLHQSPLQEYSYVDPSKDMERRLRRSSSAPTN